MQQQFPTEQEAIDAAELLARRIDCPLSPSDSRILRAVTRSGSTLTLDLLQHTAASLKARIAEIRWQRETGGVEVMPGIVFPTTRDVVTRPAIELQRAEAIGSGYSKEFVIKSQVITINLSQLRAVVAAIDAHIAACFAWEAALIKRIDAGENLDTIAAELV